MEREAIYTEESMEKIESTDWDFIGENTQMHLHSLHPYPARMIPQIPARAIELWSKKGDRVLDPFAGCGTTLLEAVIRGRDAVGVDNNPVACLISSAKTAYYSEEDVKCLKDFFEALDVMINSPDLIPSIPVYKNMEYWFAEEAIDELGKIRACIHTLKGKPRQMALCCLSAIIVRVSYQGSDTKYVRKAADFVPGSGIKGYKAKLKSAIKCIEEINEKKTGKAEILRADGRNLEGIGDSTIDLLVTSPPYLNAYDYHKYHRHRMQWIDGDVAFARDNEIGKHDTFTRKGATPDKYFEDMAQCFSEWYRVLKEDAYCLIVVGDAIVSGEPVPVGDRFVEMMNAVGFTFRNRWIRSLDVNRKSFNQQARIKKEHVLLFKKMYNKL